MASNQIEISSIDNGGAMAIKGFNYQDAIAMLIIITNFSKDDFCIYLECRDDIEVDLKLYKIFLQVKSTKQTFSNLIKTTKNKSGKENKSILYKNLSNTSPNKTSKYKIVTPNYKDGTSCIEGEIFKKIYQYSEEQKQQIIDKLCQQGFNKDVLKERLNNSYIYVSPFDDNLEKAYTHLLGIMTQEGISVDNERGKMLLNELLHNIHKKSEIRISSTKDFEKKKISKDDLKMFSKIEKCFQYMEEISSKLENANITNFADKIEIDKYIHVVDLKYKSAYKLVEDSLTDSIDYSGKVEVIIKKLHDKSSNIEIESNLLYAILIDKYVMEIIVRGTK